MRYTNNTVLKAKNMLVSRMAYLIDLRLKKISGRALAESIGMSPSIISKLRNSVSKGISFDAILEAAQRLDVSYRLIMEHDGKGNVNVLLNMEDLESARVKALNHLSNHKHNSVGAGKVTRVVSH